MHQYQLKKTKEISKIICNQCGNVLLLHKLLSNVQLVYGRIEDKS